MQKTKTTWNAIKAVLAIVFVIVFVSVLTAPDHATPKATPAPVTTKPPESPERSEQRVKFSAVMAATEPCRTATKDLLGQLQLETIKPNDATSRSQAISETCFNDRLKVLALGMDDPAEHLCVSIISSNQVVLRSIRYATEEPTMAHLRELSRWVNELPETEQQCALALAT